MSDQNPFEEVERVFEVVSQGLGTELGAIRVDVVDEGGAFVLYADVPGVDPEDVDVRVSDGHEVTVEVTSEHEVEADDDAFVIRERSRRSTSRTVTLPAPIEESEATAGVDGGVLEVRLPKRSTDGDGTDIPVE